MADESISQLAAYSTQHSDDLMVIVDVHDVSMAPSGTDKKMTVSQLFGSPSNGELIGWIGGVPTPVILGTNLSLSGSTLNATGGGSGTVTTISVVAINGFAGTVANATTTPAITISTTVTGILKGNGTAISAATAGTDYLTGNQTITLSGDASGSGTTAITTTLATVNSNVGSYGSSTAIPSLTVNAKGLVTAVSTNAVIAPAGTLTGTTLASNVVTSSLTTVGTIGAGTWQGTTVGVAYGGTGQTSLTAHAVLLGEGTAGVGAATIGTAGRLLIDQGAAADPAFKALSGDASITAAGAVTVGAINGMSLPAPTAGGQVIVAINPTFAHWVGSVPVSSGGTGMTNVTAYSVLCGGITGTGAFQSLPSVGTSGQVLTSNGAAACRAGRRSRARAR